MKISLTKELQRYIQAEVDSGRYSSPEQMVTAAVRLMMEQEAELAELRSAIDESREQFKQGLGIPASQMTVARIRAGARQRFGNPSRKKAS